MRQQLVIGYEYIHMSMRVLTRFLVIVLSYLERVFDLLTSTLARSVPFPLSFADRTGHHATFYLNEGELSMRVHNHILLFSALSSPIELVAYNGSTTLGGCSSRRHWFCKTAYIHYEQVSKISHNIPW